MKTIGYFLVLCSFIASSILADDAKPGVKITLKNETSKALQFHENVGGVNTASFTLNPHDQKEALLTQGTDQGPYARTDIVFPPYRLTLENPCAFKAGVGCVSSLKIGSGVKTTFQLDHWTVTVTIFSSGMPNQDTLDFQQDGANSHLLIIKDRPTTPVTLRN